MTDQECIIALCDALRPFAAADDEMTPVGAKISSHLVLAFQWGNNREIFLETSPVIFRISREAVRNAAVQLYQAEKHLGKPGNEE